jgi:hypothetical protein
MKKKFKPLPLYKHSEIIRGMYADGCHDLKLEYWKLCTNAVLDKTKYDYTEE